MKIDFKRKFALVALIMGVSMLSIQSLGINFSNEAKAGWIWFADENGKEEKCVTTVSVERQAELQISKDGGGFNFISKNALFRGSQDSCEDAGILYVCRQNCSIVNWNPIQL